MGYAAGFAVGQRAGAALGGAISTALQKNGIDKEVADAMAMDATKEVKGDYGKSMGLQGADQQAAQLKEQDAGLGMEGAQATAGALNYASNDPTPASTQGLSETYRLNGQESDKPFTQRQLDSARMSKVADIYAKHGLTEQAFALKDKVTAGERDDEEYARKKKGWAADDATAARAAAVQQGIASTFKTQREAEEASGNAATFQRDMAGVIEGKGIDATIRENAGPNATKDEIDAAIAAYHGSMDDATRQHNAAGMDNFYRQQAQVFGEIGGDPVKAAAALKLAEAEGVPKLIEALKAGDVDGANKLWNSTGQGRGIVKSVGTNKKTGDLVAVVIEPYSGKRMGANGYVNISAMERAMMSAAEVAKMRETESKIGENEAQATAAYANADQSRAGAGKARAETAQVGIENKILTETGEKPSAGGGKGYKVEAAEVSAALGTPVLNRRGVPETDANGKPLYSRNAAEENRFYKWMKDNKIKDTNEGLARWMSGDKPAAPIKTRAPAKPFNPKEFMR